MTQVYPAATAFVRGFFARAGQAGISEIIIILRAPPDA